MELTEKIVDMAMLSELAYLRLEDAYWTNDIDGNGMPDKSYSNYNDLKNFLSGVDSEGKPYNTGIDDDRDSVILELLSHYTIVDFKNSPTTGTPDDGLTRISDMQALLLEEKGSGNKVIAFRGTESGNDLTTDQVMSDGAVTNQMIDAMTWVEALRIKGW